MGGDVGGGHPLKRKISHGLQADFTKLSQTKATINPYSERLKFFEEKSATVSERVDGIPARFGKQTKYNGSWESKSFCVVLKIYPGAFRGFLFVFALWLNNAYDCDTII
ncbi:MAG: hypothetical protein N2Z57_03515 [Oscillospiraceae bacterium]|nr:hypothetical protein [Oscillospiraceae bacterium]